MAEEEREIVRRVPDIAQDDMVLPRIGTLASWIRNTMTEMNKAYGAAIAAFIEAGGTCPYSGPGCNGDIVVAQNPFVEIACRKWKQCQWMPREGHFLDETPKGAYTPISDQQAEGPIGQKAAEAQSIDSGLQ